VKDITEPISIKPIHIQDLVKEVNLRLRLSVE